MSATLTDTNLLNQKGEYYYMFRIVENTDGTLSLCYGDSIIVKDLVKHDMLSVAKSLCVEK